MLPTYEKIIKYANQSKKGDGLDFLRFYLLQLFIKFPGLEFIIITAGNEMFANMQCLHSAGHL
jgi:hypothetical protein